MNAAIPHYFPQPLSLDPICDAALSCFTVNGFHGTSIRQIASAAQLSVPGLYHHYPSKSAILVRLGQIAMTGLLAASHRAVDNGTTAVERFEHLVACLIQFHAEFQDIAFVTFSEIRSLPAEAREEHLQARREVQEILTGVVEEGAREGVFATAHPRHAARAITNICMGVSQWYRTHGTLGVNDLVSIYTDVCKDTVGCRAG